MDNTMGPQGAEMMATQPGQDPGEDKEGMLMKLIEASKQGGQGASKQGESSKGGEMPPSENSGLSTQVPQQM